MCDWYSYDDDENMIVCKNPATHHTSCCGHRCAEHPHKRGAGTPLAAKDAPAPSDPMLAKPLLWGKHCRGAGCDDFNEQQPSCICKCAACRPLKDAPPTVGEADIHAGCSENMRRQNTRIVEAEIALDASEAARAELERRLATSVNDARQAMRSEIWGFIEEAESERRQAGRPSYDELRAERDTARAEVERLTKECANYKGMLIRRREFIESGVCRDEGDELDEINAALSGAKGGA